jgi:transcriptional regulator GlxA family with amidase domain
VRSFFLCYRQTKILRVISAPSPEPITLRLRIPHMDRRIEIVKFKMESDPASCQISALAASVKLSVSRFRHLFQQETGVTPARYLKAIRLQKAELLIRTTFVPVKEILIKVGLRSDSHFWREFRKAYGMSPADYRNMYGLTTDGSKKKSSS